MADRKPDTRGLVGNLGLEMPKADECRTRRCDREALIRERMPSRFSRAMPREVRSAVATICLEMQ